MPSTALIRAAVILLWLVPLSAGAQRSIHQCRDAQNRLIYQDQPCRGDLRRADEPAQSQRWLSEALGPCQMRSPAIQLPLFNDRLVAAEGGGTDEPLVVGVWLELHGSRDGVALRIRGFDPLPDSGMSFDPDITGQGIRTSTGHLIAIDSLDGPGSLRYGYRGSTVLLAELLNGGTALLEVRVRGFQTVPTVFDLAPILEAAARLQSCRLPSRLQATPKRRLPGR